MAEKLVRSFDMDDTLVDRGVFLRAVGLAAHKAKLRQQEMLLLEDIPKLDHLPAAIPVESLHEKVLLKAHAARSLLPGAVKLILEGGPESVNIVNSGRSNKEEWVGMSLGQLRRLGVEGCFSEFYFKPRGASSTESKLDVIRHYTEQGDQVIHYDDDPRTSVEIARLFPDAKVNLVHHRITGLMIPTKVLAQYPNLEVITFPGRSQGRST